jgi:Fe-S-cluster-containing dehydrogenase component
MTKKSLWRSIDDVGTEELAARVAQEFPSLAEAIANPVDRRQVLKLMAASLAWGGLSACGDTKHGAPLIAPVRLPPNMVPGSSSLFATAHVLGGYAQGILVKHVMGRPLIVEGNPHHPGSFGATDVFAQALPLDFYDPDRAAQVSSKGDPSYRAAFDAAHARSRDSLLRTGGAGLRLLSGCVSSPSLLEQIDTVRKRYPESGWISWEPSSRQRAREATRQLYGKPLDLVGRIDRADVVLGIESDLFSTDPGRLRYARDFASRRNPVRSKMSRIYAIESTPTLLGSVADHRFVAETPDIERIVVWLLQGVRADGSRSASVGGRPRWLDGLIEDLKGSHGKVWIHAGAHLPVAIQKSVLLLNEALDARNETYTLIDASVRDSPSPVSDLVSDMHAGKVTHLIMLDSNPVYAAPAAWEFSKALARVPFSVSLARHLDETARICTWYLPLAHSWETWSDAKGHDGSVTIMQPQALPLYDGISASEFLSTCLLQETRSAEDIVHQYWRSQLGASFESSFAAALASGVLAGSAAAPSALKASRHDEVAGDGAKAGEPSLTLQLQADPSLFDGRYANNPWLQELPRPLTKITWGNPLLISPALAGQNHLVNGDEVRLHVGELTVTAPVVILPGQAPRTVTALLGSGRSAAGRVADHVGVNFHPFIDAQGPVRIEKTGANELIATTVRHDLLNAADQDLLKHLNLEEVGQLSSRPAEKEPADLYRLHPPGNAQWAMSIDLNACIGCNACVVACQAENNIPVVGKSQVLREREMHWLRIDRYLEGDPAEPESFFQPVLCMHCEQAPCENVCPVGATVHDSEGLNLMVYNRCIGTKFCSNNCPYKVRRFNFFGYAKEQQRPAASWNPEVTTRARGVMEKCTYCVQRVAAARIEADKESKPIGKVTTACEAACPSQAITFGNLADSNSKVVERKASPLNFVMLPDQATKPRTSYEAKVKNPNPRFEDPKA